MGIMTFIKAFKGKTDSYQGSIECKNKDLNKVLTFIRGYHEKVVGFYNALTITRDMKASDMYYYVNKLAVKGKGATYGESWDFTIKVINGVVVQVDLSLVTLESKKMFAEFQKKLEEI